MSDIKYYYTKRPAAKVIFNLCMIAAAFTIFLFILYGNISEMPAGIIVFWGIYIVFTGYGIVHAFRNKPTLVIDERGILDNSSFNRIGRIEWQEIKEIEIRQGINMRFLCIYLFDQNNKLREINIFKRLIIKTNLKKLGTICTIPEISVNAELEEIIQEMKLRLNLKEIQN